MLADIMRCTYRRHMPQEATLLLCLWVLIHTFSLSAFLIKTSQLMCFLLCVLMPEQKMYFSHDLVGNVSGGKEFGHH